MTEGELVEAEHDDPPARGFDKVRFALEPDADGWPPVTSEGLWAEPLGAGRYRVDNTPWFVRNLSADDVVVATPDAEGVLWATRRIHFSGRMTVRVIPYRRGPLMGDLQAVLDTFAELGVTGEGAEPAYPIVALDIPADADLAPIVARLRRGHANGLWDYEEASVTDEWLEL